MKHNEIGKRHFEILSSLSTLPRKIVSLHGNENITEFVLHELCHEQCFNFDKAAFFIDNPDFNCIKGVAGLCRQETKFDKNIWEYPAEFSNHMQNSEFNKRVRSFMQCSLKKDTQHDQDIAQRVAQAFGMHHFEYCSINLKHDNHGILIFERAQADDAIDEEHVRNGISLLSFCPVF